MRPMFDMRSFGWSDTNLPLMFLFGYSKTSDAAVAESPKGDLFLTADWQLVGRVPSLVLPAVRCACVLGVAARCAGC
jgi:hypothetical protein